MQDDKSPAETTVLFKYDEDESRRLRNLRRRVDRARNFPVNTCPASRHLQMMGDALARGRPYPQLEEEPGHCAETMLAVVESLWKLRTRLAELESARAK